MAIAKIKNFLDSSIKNLSSPIDRSVNIEPEIGLRIIHSPNDKTLKVTVLGARHLPQNFGFTRVNSYVVKIKLIPGKEKFETGTRNESWPQWNEEFVFNLRKETKSKFGKTKVIEEEIGASRFVVATLYAILEDKPLIATEKKENEKENKSTQQTKNDSKETKTSKDSKKENKNKKDNPMTASSGSMMSNQENTKESKNKIFTQLFGKSSDKVSEAATNENKKAFEKRRTIGATTVSLDPACFNTKPLKPKHPQDVSTGDMWRTLKPISSGISGAEERRENKKGQVELSLCQEKSDKKDVSGGRLVLSLNRLRCSLHTMHEHEALKGQLYIKMSVVDAGKIAQFWKSDRFAPCVSLKFDPEQAKVVAENPYEGALKDVSFVIKFVSKNKMGKKTTVGHFVLGPEVGGTYSEQYKQAMTKPGQHVVKWQAFE